MKGRAAGRAHPFDSLVNIDGRGDWKTFRMHSAPSESERKKKAYTIHFIGRVFLFVPLFFA